MPSAGHWSLSAARPGSALEAKTLVISIQRIMLEVSSTRTSERTKNAVDCCELGSCCSSRVTSHSQPCLRQSTRRKSSAAMMRSSKMVSTTTKSSCVNLLGLFLLAVTFLSVSSTDPNRYFKMFCVSIRLAVYKMGGLNVK